MTPVLDHEMGRRFDLMKLELCSQIEQRLTTPAAAEDGRDWASPVHTADPAPASLRAERERPPGAARTLLRRGDRRRRADMDDHK